MVRRDVRHTQGSWESGTLVKRFQREAAWRCSMPSPRNASLSGEQTMHAILDALDQHKQRLLAIVESEGTTPEDKYEALMRLASLAGILTRTLGEAEAENSN